MDLSSLIRDSPFLSAEEYFIIIKPTLYIFMKVKVEGRLYKKHKGRR